MRSDTGRDALIHGRYYIDLIGSFVEGFDFPRFAADPRTLHAVTRCLEIISEASRRIPAEVKTRHPSIPWRQMADAGNSTVTNTRMSRSASFGQLFRTPCRHGAT